MNKYIAFLLCLCFLSTAANSPASVIDAPHDETNNIQCGSCHTYSLWWQYSPSEQNIVPGRDAVINTVCMQCHDTGGSAPLTRTHSAAIIGSSTYHNGTWGVGCTTCHNPHFQDQLSWIGTASSPYLITGTIDSVTPDFPQTGQTTVTYSAATTNTNWPAVGATSNDRSWTNKNSTGRSLIFVHDQQQADSTFSIVSAGTSQIVINGNLAVGAIDPSISGNSATSNTFGLIYGQLICHNIETPFSGPRDVKFFDPNDGFVNTAANGICQVCHTETLHYRNNRPETKHHIRETCTKCHQHSIGFSINPKDCVKCHANYPEPPSSGAHALHAGTSSYAFPCQVCHKGGMSPWKPGLDSKVQLGFNLVPLGILDFSGADTHYDGTPETFADPNGYGSAYQGENGTTITTNDSLTCSNIYCHSSGQASEQGCLTAEINGKANQTPPWNSKGQLTCKSCHPQIWDNTTLSTHYRHVIVNQYSCDYCHYGTTTDGTTITNKSFHADGTIEVIAGPKAGNDITWDAKTHTCTTCFCHRGRAWSPEAVTCKIH